MENKKHLNIKKIVALVAIMLFIIVLILVVPKVKRHLRYKNLSVMYNNELQEISTAVIVSERGTIYFDLQDVERLFDENMYYNEVEKQLISTYDTHVLSFGLNSLEVLVNDEKREINAPAYIDDTSGIVFIPLSELKGVYNIDIEYNTKTNRVIIDSLSNEKTTAKVEKKTKLKERKGLFAKTIEKVLAGDVVTILESSGGSKKVRLQDGEIGYIKAKALGEETKEREATVYQKPELKVFDNYANITGVYGAVETEPGKLNVVDPVFFEIDKDSNLLDKSQINTAAYAVYSSWAENNGLKIMPSCANLDSVSNNLLNYSQRVNVINRLTKLTKEYGFVGINIDFDQVDDVNSFYRFLIELQPRFKEEGLYVSVTVKNNKNIQRNKIQNIVDYVVEE